MSYFPQYSKFTSKRIVTVKVDFSVDLARYFCGSNHGIVKIRLFRSFSEKITADLDIFLKFKMLRIQSLLGTLLTVCTVQYLFVFTFTT